MRTISVWLLLAGAVLVAAAVYGCGGAQPAPAPKRLEAPMHCFAAELGGQQLVTCAESPELCEAARVATAPEAEWASASCHPIDVRLDGR